MMNRPAPSNRGRSGSQGSVHYNLQGLLWQSLAFTGLLWQFRRKVFLGMTWATVFSTQQNINLSGESAAGSTEGYLYVIGRTFVLHP
jgi:hypothetical protein